MDRNKKPSSLLSEMCFTVSVLTLGLLFALVPVGSTGAPPSLTRLAETRAAAATPRGAILNEGIQPIFYKIYIQPNYANNLTETNDFNGMVEITVNIKSNTKSIQLHAGSGMKITRCQLRDEAGDIDVPGKLEEDIYTLDLPSAVKGDQTIVLNYTGIFQTEFNGFYKSTYKKYNSSETGVLFTTHFQAPHARKAFPCFDEPSFKSNFSLTLHVPDGYSALSNTPPIEPLSGNIITFQTTVKMSTYLVAFIIYEVDSYYSTDSEVVNGVIIRTWGRNDAIMTGLAAYSQKVAPMILEVLENYTNIPYSVDQMTKIDQAAMPDFSAGAMENWGLIIYRDSRLFFNETSDGASGHKSVAAIIAHELTHQWFGNLVTTKWWDTTWLNEGFARYMQYFILSRVYPGWRMMDQLLVDQQMTVFLHDSGDGDALTKDVTTLDEIRGQFGTITYSKGASFLRMISKVLGEENFQEALQEYLQSRAYDWVIPKNLYDALNSKTPDDRKPTVGLAKALDTWETQPGFPVVNVQRNYEEKTITFTQTRFFPDGAREKTEIYNVPVIWSSRVNTAQRVTWFTSPQTITDDDDLENWILVHAGYYRVNYDEMNWFTLMLTMRLGNRSVIAPEDRTQLFEDSLALAAAGYMPYNTTTFMLRCLPDETDVLPWAAISRHLDKLDLLLGNVNSEIFYGFLKSATLAVYEELEGFSNIGSLVQLIHRPTILRWACRSGNTDCLEKAVAYLEDHLQHGTELVPTLSNVIFCYGIMKGESKQWHKVWDIYKTSEDDNQKEAALAALGCTENPTLIKLLLGSSLAQSIGDSEMRSIFSACLSHPKGIAATLNFVLEETSQMRLNLQNNTFENILRDLANYLSSETQFTVFKKILQNEFEQGHMTEEILDELTEIPQKNLAWMKAYGEEALNAFEKATRPYQEVTTPNTIGPTPGDSSTMLINIKLLILLLIVSFMW